MKILISLVLFLFIFLFWLQPFNLGEKEIFIPKGTNAHKVAEILKSNGILREKNEFLFWVKLLGRERKIKPGTYTLKRYKNPLYLIQKLTAGVKSDIVVTIPEGMTIVEIAEILAKKGLVVKEEFLGLCHSRKFIDEMGIPGATLEGYLFPDTYFFSPFQNDSQIIMTFLKNFKGHIENLVMVNPDSLHKIITLASIVEKEAKYDDERPIIARVFLNRLRLRRTLESCATVIYARQLSEPGSIINNLTEKDLEIQSPYNTYIHQGLPPGPICSPGEKSIKAVLFPKEVDYLYFVSMGNGRHHFSKTYRDHLNARKFYNAQKRF